MSMTTDQQRRTFADKLAHLIATVHPADREPYSYREIAEAIREHPGAMTAQYISQLKTGARTNPKMDYVQALAEFFGVPVSYFFDDEVAERLDAQLADLSTWRDSQARHIAERVTGLDEQGRAAVSNLIDTLQQYQQQPRNQRQRRKNPRDQDT